MDVPSGWVQILRGPRPPSHQWPRADVQRKRQPHAPVGTGSERHRGSPSSSPQQRQRQSGDSPQLSHVPRVSKSPDDVRKCAFSKVARLQAAIASLDEDDPERSSLQQALKRAQQQTVLPPVDQRIADCVQFIERAKKRVQSAEADAKKAVEVQRLREGELAVAEQRSFDPPARSRKSRVGSFLSTSTSNARGDRPANSSAGSSSRVGFGDSEVAHRGGQIQGKSTCPGFGRSSPKCACEGRKTPRWIHGRHAHRRTESEVVAGGQKSGDARCVGCGRHRGDIFVGAVDREGCRSNARELSTENVRRRASVSFSSQRGEVRALLREARTSRCTARYGHRGTRVGEEAHPGPTRRLRRVVDARNVVPRLSTQATVVDSSDSADEMPLMRRSIGPQEGLEGDVSLPQTFVMSDGSCPEQRGQCGVSGSDTESHVPSRRRRLHGVWHCHNRRHRRHSLCCKCWPDVWEP